MSDFNSIRFATFNAFKTNPIPCPATVGYNTQEVLYCRIRYRGSTALPSMWRHHQIHAFLYLYLGAIIWIHEITTTASRGMTTFKTESMRIRAPKRSNDGNVFEEAFQLIKQHFIDRSRYSENEWKNLKREYGSIPDPHEAIRRFLRTFSDPYTTFYEPTTMVHKSEVLRGEKVTLGLSLGRKWNFSNLGQLRVSIKDSFKRVFSSDFSVIIQHKLTLCKYTAASLTLMPGVSIHISNQLMRIDLLLIESLF